MDKAIVRIMYVTLGLTYYQDWNGSWYYVTTCGIYHLGSVLSDWLDQFSISYWLGDD